MKRNIQVSFQVSLLSNLSDDELKKNITDAVVKTMTSIKDADPLGLYLITVEQKPGQPFPQAPSESSFVSDLQMDRKREFEKELKEDQMWQEQG